MAKFITDMRRDADHGDVELAAVACAFRRLAETWRLSDAEVDALLFEREGRWAALRGGCDHWVLSVECERRMRRCLDLDAALRTWPAGIADVGAWLRRPNPCIRVGRPSRPVPPLRAMCCDPGALATIRDLVLAEVT